MCNIVLYCTATHRESIVSWHPEIQHFAWHIFSCAFVKFKKDLPIEVSCTEAESSHSDNFVAIGSPQVVVMTIYHSICDDKVGSMSTRVFTVKSLIYPTYLPLEWIIAYLPLLFRHQLLELALILGIQVIQKTLPVLHFALCHDFLSAQRLNSCCCWSEKNDKTYWQQLTFSGSHDQEKYQHGGFNSSSIHSKCAFNNTKFQGISDCVGFVLLSKMENILL